MTSGWPAATQLRVSGTLDLDPESPAFTKAPVKALVVTVGASSRVKQEAVSRVADVLVRGDDKLHAGVMLDAFAKRGLRQVLCEGGDRRCLGHFSTPIA
jgi:riboflavin biosynthesis pyrimidine reductase